MVCVRCTCTDAYVYKRPIGVLRSIWSTDVMLPKACPTICESCIMEFPGDATGMLYSNLTTDITIDEFARILGYVEYLTDTYTPTSMPTEALTHSGLALPLRKESLPTGVDGFDKMIPDVDVCCMHDDPPDNTDVQMVRVPGSNETVLVDH